MKGERAQAAAVILMGVLICGWQLYELEHTDHLTLWMIGGFLPVPVIVFGGLAILAGLILLVRSWRG